MKPRHHDHAECVREALATAARLCAERGVRLTPLRRRVLELIWSGHGAVKAYDLLTRIGDDGAAAKPPTVYRALDFLREQGFVHRIDSLNAFVGCPEPEGEHDAQLLICSQCGTVDELHDPEVSAVVARGAARSGFRVARQTIEAQGICAQCRGAPPAGDAASPR